MQMYFIVVHFLNICTFYSSVINLLTLKFFNYLELADIGWYKVGLITTIDIS